MWRGRGRAEGYEREQAGLGQVREEVSSLP